MASEFKENYMNAKKEAHEASKAYISEVRKNFKAFGFIEIDNKFYNKSQLVWVSFNDTNIHARFVSGDIVTITEEQLELLTT